MKVVHEVFSNELSTYVENSSQIFVSKNDKSVSRKNDTIEVENQDEKFIVVGTESKIETGEHSNGKEVEDGLNFNVKAFQVVKSSNCGKCDGSCTLTNCAQNHMHRKHVRLRSHCSKCDNND